MKLTLVGISHHRAPVEIRETMALDLRGCAALAAELAAGGEAVVLSTCNRTELYLVRDREEPAEEIAVRALAGLAGREPGEVTSLLYRLADEAVARHLFRVAAGLDSLVPGEGEILGQVRAAFEAGRPGPVLDRLFRQALHAGGKVRAETAIGESPASVPAAAAALAQQIFGDLRGKRIVLLGAGKMSAQAARNLTSRGAEIVVVANRTLGRGAELAASVGARAVELGELGAELARADVVFASTSAPGFVVGKRDVPARRGRPLLFVDLAVPRDVDPAVTELEDCYLYDIDDLEAVVAESLAGRRAEAARAERIVAAEADRFRDWLASLEVVPAIASLRARAEEIRAGELARLGHLPESERRLVESVTAAIVNKFLHLPTIRLKEAAAAADGVVYADVVRHLFGLGEEDGRS